MTNTAVGAIAFVTLLTIVVGARGIRVARTPDDFMVAARQVPPGLNAAAISGEYLSAASFLGIAGLIVSQGLGSLWYSVGYTAGYLVLLLLVAAPLRRFGAYTIPDFADGRLGSRGLRQAATALVLVIGWFYLLPQMKGAGITLQYVLARLLGRRDHARRGRERQYRDGRDEGHYVRPVLPVLAEALRDRHSRAGAADRDRPRLRPQPPARPRPGLHPRYCPAGASDDRLHPAPADHGDGQRPARPAAVPGSGGAAVRVPPRRGRGRADRFRRGRPGPHQPGHGAIAGRVVGLPVVGRGYGRRPSPAGDLWHHHRHVLRRGRAAAHSRALLHQPRRRGGPAHDADRAAPAEHVLPVPGRAGRADQAARAPAVPGRRLRQRHPRPAVAAAPRA